jgi:metal-responsive CopG/Arc/MetJ family transcriptional regulator
MKAAQKPSKTQSRCSSQKENGFKKTKITLQTGILLIVYDHDIRGLETKLTEAQHQHSMLISSTLHIHVSERDCLEAIAVKGKASEIRKLRDELSTKKGVKILKTMIVTV